MILLATDLDGTFTGGDSLRRLHLYELIKDSSDIRLVFVTGRGVETVVPLLKDPVLPQPDYIICDVGATLVNGRTLEPLEPLQRDIKKRWPGSAEVLDLLKDVDGLQYQEVPQHRRCSFYTKDETIVDIVRKRVAPLGCDVIYSAKKFLDVLPKGVNKGSTLRSLVNYLGFDKSNVLVAGDTLNDLAMFQWGYRGVVVGNAEEKLKLATLRFPNIFYASEAGAGGVIEAMEHFDFISKYKISLPVL